MRRRINERPRLRLDDLDGDSYMDLVLGWNPGRGRRWQGWADVLADYEQVRDELIALFPDCDPQAPFFYAESVRRYRQHHGLAALMSATSEDIRAFKPRQEAGR